MGFTVGQAYLHASVLDSTGTGRASVKRLLHHLAPEYDARPSPPVFFPPLP